MTKSDLTVWVEAALETLHGRARVTDVAKEIWKAHELDLRASGDLFYTWQYDMRWSANVLRRKGVLKPVAASSAGMWELV